MFSNPSVSALDSLSTSEGGDDTKAALAMLVYRSQFGASPPSPLLDKALSYGTGKRRNPSYPSTSVESRLMLVH